MLPKKCSKIDLPLKCEPWAPDVNQLHDGTYALYYSVSTLGSQESAIGLATSKTMEEGSWTDHGAIMRSHPGDKANGSTCLTQPILLVSRINCSISDASSFTLHSRPELVFRRYQAHLHLWLVLEWSLSHGHDRPQEAQG